MVKPSGNDKCDQSHTRIVLAATNERGRLEFAGLLGTRHWGAAFLFDTETSGARSPTGDRGVARREADEMSTGGEIRRGNSPSHMAYAAAAAKERDAFSAMQKCQGRLDDATLPSCLEDFFGAQQEWKVAKAERDRLALVLLRAS